MPSDNFMHDGIWLGGVQSRLPAFSGKAPPMSSSVTLCHDEDTVLVSVGGGPLETVRASRFKALLRDGKTEGHIHVGVKGEVQIAPFALLRAYMFGSK